MRLRGLRLLVVHICISSYELEELHKLGSTYYTAKSYRKLASNPGFTFRILSRSFGEKSEVKPGRIWHVIRWHRDVTPY